MAQSRNQDRSISSCNTDNLNAPSGPDEASLSARACRLKSFGYPRIPHCIHLSVIVNVGQPDHCIQYSMSHRGRLFCIAVIQTALWFRPAANGGFVRRAVINRLGWCCLAANGGFVRQADVASARGGLAARKNDRLQVAEIVGAFHDEHWQQMPAIVA